MPELASGYGGGGAIQSHTPNAGDSQGIIPGFAVGSKGTWTELVSSTGFDANWIEVEVPFANNWPMRGSLDIAIGGGGSEIVIIPDLLLYGRGAGAIMLPCYIPANSRLSARQELNAGAGYGIGLRVISGTALSGGVSGKVTQYGGLANRDGTVVDPGGTANTDSAWVEITPSTTEDHQYLAFAGRFGDGSVASTHWRVQLGIGASGSEQVLVPNLSFWASSTSGMAAGSLRSWPKFIPAGSRLSVRGRCSSTTTGDREFGVRLYGAG